MNTLTYTATNMDEMSSIIKQHPGFIKADWCGNTECEIKLKDKTGIKSRCILENEEKITGKLKKYSKVNRNDEFIYVKSGNNYSFINNILIDLFYVILIFLMVFTTSNITTIVFISIMYYLILDTTLSICEVISMYDTFEISIYKVLDLFDLEKEKINHLNKINIEKSTPSQA